ncbi:MAG: response regulator transcription factor [Spirochaetales bacterium]|nr:response regulator transcription factor [Spirochaetales bacterium]
MEEKCILIAEDEAGLRESMVYVLRKEGYQVVEYGDGLDAFSYIEKKMPDLILLDILMPGLDGLQLCARVRSLCATVPVMFISSKDEEFDRVLGLELGADDYLCKPFSLKEMVARVRALLRRSSYVGAHESLPRLEVGRVAIDAQQMFVWIDGELATFSLTEFRIIESLIKRPGVVKEREQLIFEVYNENFYLNDRAIDCHIKRIRKKIEQVAPGFQPIEAVYGVGYRWKKDF